MSSMIKLWLCILWIARLISCSSGDWIDPDTPIEARTTYAKSVVIPRHPSSEEVEEDAPTHNPTGEPTPSPTRATAPVEFELVFSDEFNVPNRTFEDGSDPRWTALDKNDYTNRALHYYSPENVRTDDSGHLVISSEAANTQVVGFDDVKYKKTVVTKHFRSGMVQSWNKFCMTGGIVEAEVVLPGRHNVGGLWPAFWLLGNLARHTYVGSSSHIWPFSASECNPKSRFAQQITACDKVQHYGFQPGVGRGAPEIDIFEVQPGPLEGNKGVFARTPVGQPFMSASFQVAPGRSTNRPPTGFWPKPGQWYSGLIPGNMTALNIMFYGDYNHFSLNPDPAEDDYWSDAISLNRQLTQEHFDKPHVYRVEWDVPDLKNKNYGSIHWYLDGELVFSLNGTSLVDAGEGSHISTEPSYILFNTAISKNWGFPPKCPGSCSCKKYNCLSDKWDDSCSFPEGFCDMMKRTEDSPDVPLYKINWVRAYQNPKDPKHKVGCSTPERPTRKYIQANAYRYKTENDKHPLKSIENGGGECTASHVESQGNAPPTRDNCGGAQRGSCARQRTCVCHSGWTGPHCMTHAGFNDIDYDPPDTWRDMGFSPPTVVPLFLVVGIAMLVVFVTAAVTFHDRIKQYQPIPDHDDRR